MLMAIAAICFFSGAIILIAEGVKKHHAGVMLTGVGMLAVTFVVALVS